MLNREVLALNKTAASQTFNQASSALPRGGELPTDVKPRQAAEPFAAPINRLFALMVSLVLNPFFDFAAAPSSGGILTTTRRAQYEPTWRRGNCGGWRRETNPGCHERRGLVGFERNAAGGHVNRLREHIRAHCWRRTAPAATARALRPMTAAQALQCCPRLRARKRPVHGAGFSAIEVDTTGSLFRSKALVEVDTTGFLLRSRPRRKAEVSFKGKALFFRE